MLRDFSPRRLETNICVVDCRPSANGYDALEPEEGETMVAGLPALAMCFIKLFPRTLTAEALHLYLVELPIRAAQNLERRHLILLAIFLAIGQSLALIGSAELAIAYAVDMSIYYDALLAASAVTAAMHIKAAWLSLKTRIPRLPDPRPLINARSPRRAKAGASRQAPANDDGDDSLLAAA
jgi:hypothetical protein